MWGKIFWRVGQEIEKKREGGGGGTDGKGGYLRWIKKKDPSGREVKGTVQVRKKEEKLTHCKEDRGVH